MKKVLSILMTLMMLSSMFTVFSVTNSAETISYVESFMIAKEYSEEAAKKDITNKGYTLVSDVDMYKGSMASDLYVYMGYKTTTDPDNAIRDIVIIEEDVTTWINPANKCTYDAVDGYISGKSYAGIFVNNYHIMVTKDAAAGNPIANPVVSYDDDYVGRNKTACDKSGEIVDLSHGSFSAWDVYLYYDQNIDLYYSDLFLGASEDYDDAIEHLYGYELLSDYDLNEDCSSDSDYIFLGYKRTVEQKNAIRDIICVYSSEPITDKTWYNQANNCTYKAVGGLADNNERYTPLDVNRNAGGDYIYLYYTTDSDAGAPITSFYIDESVATGWEVVRCTNGERANLNHGTDDDDIRLMFKRNPLNEEDNIVRYYESFQLGVDWDEEDAKNYATMNDYVLVSDMDLNEGILFADDVYLGCKYTTNSDKAIRDIVALVGNSYTGELTWTNPANDCVYTAVGGYNDSTDYQKQVDANDGTGGNFIYLYVTTDAKAGNPISDIYIGTGDNTERTSHLRNAVTGRKIDLAQSVTSTKSIYMYYNQYSYYSKLQLGLSYDSYPALECAVTNGYELVSELNLNEGCAENADYIYLSCVKTGDTSNVIRDIVCLRGSDYKVSSWLNPSNNCTYYPVNGYSRSEGRNAEFVTPLDVNSYTGYENDDELYLYYTTDPKAGDPINEIVLTNILLNAYSTVKFQDDSMADLNFFAGDYDIYMQYKRASVNTGTGSIFGGNSTLIIIVSASVIVVGVVIGVFFSRKRNKTLVV